MNVPNEIKTAVKDLHDYMRNQIGPRDTSKVHDEAMRLLREIWGVREQIPAPEHSADEYFTEDKLEFAHIAQDWQAEQEVLWGGRLIGHALDRYFNRLNVWQYHRNKDEVDTSWVDPLVDRVIKKLQLTPRNLKPMMHRKALESYIVKLEMVPLEGSRILKEAVEDLTADQKQALADLMKYQGLPDDTTEGILASLYTDIRHVIAPEFAELGAVCGLFYQVWLRLMWMETA